MKKDASQVIWFENLRRADAPLVGGKNSWLGEIARIREKDVRVPPGFATTADAYRRFLAVNGLDAKVAEALADLRAGKATVAEVGDTIRRAILRGEWDAETAAVIRHAHAELCRRTGRPEVAVRSSAIAEGRPHASFARQHETYLNVCGGAAVLDACRRCYASLFTDRAISYRQAKGFDHLKVALSVGVQRMVRSDLGGAGVMFSVDTETGFDKAVLINAGWGLGENIAQGAIDADEYQVFKPLLSQAGLTPIIEKKIGEKAQKMVYDGADAPTRNVPTSKAERARFVLNDAEILTLARIACVVEEHYGCPVRMEWAKDGEDGEIFVVQVCPETARSRKEAASLRSYHIKSKGRTLVTGLSIGGAVVSARVCLIENQNQMDRFVNGAVLVTKMTDPDWAPLMERAAAIVTDHGGRTSHAAIVARELGLPAIVGTGNATHLLHDEQEVTISCAEGDHGFVYDQADYEIQALDVKNIPSTKTKIMLNLANPAAAFRWWRLPADGVGLARMEFVINNYVKVHPMALVCYEKLEDEKIKKEISDLTQNYGEKTEYFVDRLSRGLAHLAAVFYPKPVIVRMSDFKTDEYANLIGGSLFEPREENPMIGFRGACRYYSPRYREGFALECKAIRRLRDELGFRNVIIMIPFCRTVGEADRVLEVMRKTGLERGRNGLRVYLTCEIPANVILAKDFAARFDGFSIGSNDLTQLTLGVDRDSEELAGLFEERDAAVKWMIGAVIRESHAAGLTIGLCGQAPSDHPDFAEFLVASHVDSISVIPDSFLAVKQHVAQAEKRCGDG